MLDFLLFGALGLVGASAAAWLGYFRWKDREHPEPRLVVAMLVVGGAIAVGAAMLGYDGIAALGRSPTWTSIGHAPLLHAMADAVLVGLLEEGAKLAILVPIALFCRHFDEILDGPIYAGIAAVGFAGAETLSLFLAGKIQLGQALLHAVATPLTHALLAAPAGLGLAYLVLHKRKGALPLGLATSVIAHAAYDLLLARTGTSVYSALLILALWIWLIRAVPRLGRIPRVERGRAPATSPAGTDR